MTPPRGGAAWVREEVPACFAAVISGVVSSEARYAASWALRLDEGGALVFAVVPDE